MIIGVISKFAGNFQSGLRLGADLLMTLFYQLMHRIHHFLKIITHKNKASL